MGRPIETVESGSIVEIPRGGIDLVCCDCGLTHRWTVVGGGAVRIRIWRMSRSTSYFRRKLKQLRAGVFSK